MKKFRTGLNQFVVIPTFGFAWGNKGIHFYFAWLRFKFGFVVSNKGRN